MREDGRRYFMCPWNLRYVMKKILIISQYIAPIQAIASVRWTKIAKYLKKKYDVEITVLTNEKNYGQYRFKVEKKDPLLTEDVKYFDEYLEPEFDTFYIWVKSILYGFKAKKKNAASDMTVRNLNPNERGKKAVFKRWVDEFVHDVYYVQQAGQCLKVIKKRKFDYDVVISTFGPIWTHMIAEKLKKRNPSVLWIADFRDPYARESDTPGIFRKHQKYISRHLCHADKMVKVFEDMKIGGEEGETEVIPNGFDPEEMLPPLKPEKFIFLYTGVLYEGRQNIVPLFQAIKEFLDEKVLDEKDVEIWYAGGCFSYLQKQAESAGVEGLLTDFGYISRDDVLQKQRRAAVLFQAGWSTKVEQTAWSGKTYEYMMAQKPIISLMSGDVPFSTAWELIPKLGGVCYEESRHKETFSDLKDYIKEKYREWKKTGNVTIDADRSYIEQFSYSSIAERLWEMV